MRWLASMPAVALLLAGCSLDGLLNSDELPPDVSDPARIQTPEGAVAAYHGALSQFRIAVGGTGNQGVAPGGSFAGISALLSDELQVVDRRPGVNQDLQLVDRRNVVEDQPNGVVDDAYSRLQKVRGQASQAIALLTRYAPPEQRALTGHTYAVEGYAEVLLAELFCSGVPLSTLDYDGSFTYRPGSATNEVYEHALGLFDSALTLAADSVRFVQLARMGRARALLGLGRFADAAAAAAQVPSDYRYEVSFGTATNSDGTNAMNFARQAPSLSTSTLWEFTVADHEGINGLAFASSGDPRMAVTLLGSEVGVDVYHPDLYALDGSSPIVLASGVEARLIEAEAALQGGGDWLGILNALRTTCTDAASCPTPAPAGIGGVEGLPPLTDPGTDAARVDLLFRERAAWLFLTGHRQGDLRRLVRQYGRSASEVYPAGAYAAAGGQSYGTDVTLPIPQAERVSNSHFTGCISRGA